MNKILMSSLIAFPLLFNSHNNHSTLSVVTLVGAKIKASQTDTPNNIKYKRKDCPVCKGKGWYISGDGIAKVDCGYCEPDDGKQQDIKKDYSHPSIIIRVENE